MRSRCGAGCRALCSSNESFDIHYLPVYRGGVVLNRLAEGCAPAVFAGAVPFLKLMGIVAGGWQMARAAQISAEKLGAGSSDDFYKAKIKTARFYADHVLSQALWLKHEIARERPVELSKIQIEIAAGNFHGLNVPGMRGAGVPTKKIQRSSTSPRKFATHAPKAHQRRKPPD